jgi:hypothetical protein
MGIDLGDLAARIAGCSAGDETQLEGVFFELCGVYGELSELADRLDEIEDANEDEEVAS